VLSHKNRNNKYIPFFTPTKLVRNSQPLNQVERKVRLGEEGKAGYPLGLCSIESGEEEGKGWGRAVVH
jgi:hypothetical protein